MSVYLDFISGKLSTPEAQRIFDEMQKKNESRISDPLEFAFSETLNSLTMLRYSLKSEGSGASAANKLWVLQAYRMAAIATAVSNISEYKRPAVKYEDAVAIYNETMAFITFARMIATAVGVKFDVITGYKPEEDSEISIDVNRLIANVMISMAVISVSVKQNSFPEKCSEEILEAAWGASGEVLRRIGDAAYDGTLVYVYPVILDEIRKVQTELFTDDIAADSWNDSYDYLRPLLQGVAPYLRYFKIPKIGAKELERGVSVLSVPRVLKWDGSITAKYVSEINRIGDAIRKEVGKRNLDALDLDKEGRKLFRQEVIRPQRTKAFEEREIVALSPQERQWLIEQFPDTIGEGKFAQFLGAQMQIWATNVTRENLPGKNLESSVEKMWAACKVLMQRDWSEDPEIAAEGANGEVFSIWEAALDCLQLITQKLKAMQALLISAEQYGNTADIYDKGRNFWEDIGRLAERYITLLDAINKIPREVRKSLASVHPVMITGNKEMLWMSTYAGMCVLPNDQGQITWEDAKDIIFKMNNQTIITLNTTILGRFGGANTANLMIDACEAVTQMILPIKDSLVSKGIVGHGYLPFYFRLWHATGVYMAELIKEYSKSSPVPPDSGYAMLKEIFSLLQPLKVNMFPDGSKSLAGWADYNREYFRGLTGDCNEIIPNTIHRIICFFG